MKLPQPSKVGDDVGIRAGCAGLVAWREMQTSRRLPAILAGLGQSPELNQVFPTRFSLFGLKPINHFFSRHFPPARNGDVPSVFTTKLPAREEAFRYEASSKKRHTKIP